MQRGQSIRWLSPHVWTPGESGLVLYGRTWSGRGNATWRHGHGAQRRIRSCRHDTTHPCRRACCGCAARTRYRGARTHHNSGIAVPDSPCRFRRSPTLPAALAGCRRSREHREVHHPPMLPAEQSHHPTPQPLHCSFSFHAMYASATAMGRVAASLLITWSRISLSGFTRHIWRLIPRTLLRPILVGSGS